MTDAAILTALKIDLQISSTSLDAYLAELIQAAREYIRKEGIVLTGTTGDGMLVEMYAAYLYRSRRDAAAVMPRMLRWALNCRLFGDEVVGGGGDGCG